MSRLSELNDICAKLDPERRTLIIPILTEIVFMEQRLTDLRKLPHLRIHPKNPARQEITPAGKQYKETMQAYLNAIKVVHMAISRQETNAADELMNKLKEFEL